MAGLYKGQEGGYGKQRRVSGGDREGYGAQGETLPVSLYVGIFFVENWRFDYYNVPTLDIRFSPFLRVCQFVHLFFLVEGCSGPLL